jgi:membrane protease YdiL (CAAX protease family)
MRNLLQKLPFPVEFAVIVAGAFGYSVVSHALAMAHLQGVGSAPTEFGAWRVVAMQSVTLLLLGAFLWSREWKPSRIGLDTDWRDGLWGLGLSGASFVAVMAVATLIGVLLPTAVPQGPAVEIQPTLSPYVVCALVLVGAFYEEFFAAGYVVSALKEKGHPDLAINVGVAIRVLVHLFQGVAGVVLMVPIGLIFGTYYVKTGRLWPLILAHTLLNAWRYAAYIHW